MRDSGWDQLPPDVRFAGEALQKMRAPPWIAIYLNQPLTEKPSCEAEYMTAPERFADSQIPLAPRAPSIHDPFETCGEPLLDHLVGAAEQQQRQGGGHERLGGLAG
jgi:hypothetical protein